MCYRERRCEQLLHILGLLAQQDEDGRDETPVETPLS